MKTTTKDLMKQRQQQPITILKTTPLEKITTLTKTIKITKTKTLTMTISYSEKFQKKTIRIDNGTLHIDFTQTGEKSKGTKLIYNKIKGRLQLGKTKNEDIGTTTKELKTFLTTKIKDITTLQLSNKIIDTMEKNINDIDNLLTNEKKGQYKF